MSLSRAAKLLKIPRSRVYYKPRGETKENVMLMDRIEELYSKDPTLGYRRMRAILEREDGIKVNHKRVRRLMRLMGLVGISPTPKTTKTAVTDYKNLLKHLNVTKPNQVWCADITYVKVKGGYAYGVSIMDLYSRKVLAFEISNTMDEWMCIEAARKAMMKCGAPEIIHTDRGRQFVGRRFRRIFEEAGAKVSVGERGFKDNIVMERLWRSYKWECVYLRERMGLKKLKEVTREWVDYYNKVRPHQALGYRVPDEVYHGKLPKEVAA